MNADERTVRYDGGKCQAALVLLATIDRRVNVWKLTDAQLYARLEGRGWRWVVERRRWVLVERDQETPAW